MVVESATFPKGKKQFCINAGQHVIELATTHPSQSQIKQVAIICHPHPEHGGTMNNKVVTTVMRVFGERNYATVRFNFRGVGNSTGHYDQGVGEIDDCVTVIQWVMQQLPDTEITLAGFSFGSYIAYKVATDNNYANKINRLVMIAPPVQYAGFSQTTEPAMPWIVAMGEQDGVVDPHAVNHWLAGKQSSYQLLTFAGAGHFFHGRLVDLKHRLLEVLATDDTD